MKMADINFVEESIHLERKALPSGSFGINLLGSNKPTNSSRKNNNFLCFIMYSKLVSFVLLYGELSLCRILFNVVY